MISNEELLSYYSRGYIPGPKEDESTFLKRIAYNENLHQELDEQFVQSDKAKDFLKESSKITHETYGFTMSKIPILFSNDKLSFFHGGCAWIFQKQEKAPIGAFLQLRKAFLKETNYLYLYPRDELLAHETFHIARMAFEEPKYEEILAYKSSPSPFRRYFGALIRTPIEALIFLIILVLFIVVPILLPATSQAAFILHWVAFLLPFIYLALLGTRLFFNQRKVALLDKRIAPLLTDNEIDHFAKTRSIIPDNLPRGRLINHFLKANN